MSGKAQTGMTVPPINFNCRRYPKQCDDPIVMHSTIQPTKIRVPILNTTVSRSLRNRNKNDATHKNRVTCQPHVIGALGKVVAGSATAE